MPRNNINYYHVWAYEMAGNKQDQAKRTCVRCAQFQGRETTVSANGRAFTRWAPEVKSCKKGEGDVSKAPV